MYVVVPLWIAVGFGDYLCHRASRIEATSGIKESLLHVLQFTEVGVALLAALFLEIDSLIFSLFIVCAVLHEATAIWDVQFADRTRRLTPAEQHVHGMLEMLPFAALLILMALHRTAFESLLGLASADWTLRWKNPALPSTYLAAVLVSVLVLGAIPYGEELLRTLTYSRGRSRPLEATATHSSPARGARREAKQPR